MAAVCDICAKGPGFGNNRPWSRKITKRRFDPNIQRVRATSTGRRSGSTSAPAASRPARSPADRPLSRSRRAGARPGGRRLCCARACAADSRAMPVRSGGSPASPSYDRPVDGDPASAPARATPRPDRPVQPRRQPRGGGEGRDQRVVVAAGEHERERVDAERGAHGLQRLGDRRTPSRRTSIATPLAVGDVAEVREQPVADVDHARWRRRRAPRRRRRTAARAGGGPRRPPAASGTRGPSTANPAAAQPCRPAQRDHVAGPGARRGAPAAPVARPRAR